MTPSRASSLSPERRVQLEAAVKLLRTMRPFRHDPLCAVMGGYTYPCDCGYADERAVQLFAADELDALLRAESPAAVDPARQGEMTPGLYVPGSPAGCYHKWMRIAETGWERCAFCNARWKAASDPSGSSVETPRAETCATCRYARPTRPDVVSSMRLWCACPIPPIASDPGTLAPTFDRRVPDDYFCKLYAPPPPLAVEGDETP